MLMINDAMFEELISSSAIADSPGDFCIDILDKGVSEIFDGFLFNEFINDNSSLVMKSKLYFDLSGYEWSTNKFYLNDYCENKSHLLRYAINAIGRMKELLKANFKNNQFLLYLNHDSNSEFPGTSVTFNKIREGETVLDLDALDNYPSAILVKRIFS